MPRYREISATRSARMVDHNSGLKLMVDMRDAYALNSIITLTPFIWMKQHQTPSEKYTAGSAGGDVVCYRGNSE